MENALFTSYKQPENRVTATLLAVLERLGIALTVETLRIAAALAEDESEVVGVRFRNQLGGKEPSDTVPDAEIAASFQYLFEVKVVPGAVTEAQVRGHLARLDQDPSTRQPLENRRLWVLTPDVERPEVLNTLGGRSAAWIAFRHLDLALNGLLEPSRALPEADAALVRELRVFLDREGLVAPPADTVVVAGGRSGYKRFQELGGAAYVCQPERVFRSDTAVPYLAFYSKGHVQPEVARRELTEPSVHFSLEEAARLRTVGNEAATRLADVIEHFLAVEPDRAGKRWTVMLTAPAETLSQAVANDAVTAGGKPWAWCLGTRYTRLEFLRRAQVTSDLDRST